MLQGIFLKFLDLSNALAIALSGYATSHDVATQDPTWALAIICDDLV